MANSASLEPRATMPTSSVRLVAKELQLLLSSATRTLYFHGTSMHPFLVEGDEVVVVPVDWREIEIGDVVTYRVEDKFPTRRVVWKTSAGVRLWCENWPQRRYYAPRGDVLGRAVARKRGDWWITRRDPEWQAARRAALMSYLRVVMLPHCVRLPRRAAGKLARRLGLRGRRTVAADRR